MVGIDIRLEIFRSLLEPMRPGRLVDLGAGHGKFSLIARDLGWQVTAVDARTERIPDAPGVEWLQADVRSFPLTGYDAVCVLGLFYHLELNDQLSLLARARGSVLILDTHVALQATHTEEGYEGHLFEEKLEADTAAWGNEKSFWPTEESLRRMLSETGWRFVFHLEPWYMADRTFFVAR